MMKSKNVKTLKSSAWTRMASMTLSCVYWRSLSIDLKSDRNADFFQGSKGGGDSLGHAFGLYYIRPSVSPTNTQRALLPGQGATWFMAGIVRSLWTSTHRRRLIGCRKWCRWLWGACENSSKYIIFIIISIYCIFFHHLADIGKASAPFGIFNSALTSTKLFFSNDLFQYRGFSILGQIQLNVSFRIVETIANDAGHQVFLIWSI